MFSWLSGKEKFAKEVIGRLKEEEMPGKWSYEKDAYALRLTDNQGNKRQEIYLENYYKEFEQAAQSRRAGIIDKIVATTRAPQIPDDFEQAAPQILPHVKPRWDTMVATMSLQKFSGKGLELSIPILVVGDAFAIVPVYDLPHEKALLHSQQLDVWGKSAGEVFDRASANLLARTQQARFEAVQDSESGRIHVYMSMWHDGYDASRLLFSEMIASLAVDGDHVIAMPSHDQLMITGTNDALGLTMVVAELEKSWQRPSALAPLPLVLRNGSWSRYASDTSNPLNWALKRLEARYFAGVYEHQKTILNDICERSGTDMFVGSYVAVQSPEGKVGSYCTLTEGVPTLLPKTDHINLVRVEGERAEKVACGRWSRVISIFGDLLVPTDDFPPRFMAKGFPTADQLAQIGAEDIFADR